MSKEHDEKMAKYIIEDHLVKDSVKQHKSPSEKYTLETARYDNPGFIGDSKGTVRKGDEIIEVVNRNYTSFPFEWVESHPNGHDYLICGETYMGQTIIELDTGKRIDFNCKEGQEGFCWAEFKISPNKEMLAVAGCYWAAPYELWVVDFEYPMFQGYENTPQTKWRKIDGPGDYGIEEFSWNEDGTLNVKKLERYYPQAGKPWSQTTDEERKVEPPNDDSHYCFVNSIWHPPKLELTDFKVCEDDEW